MPSWHGWVRLPPFCRGTNTSRFLAMFHRDLYTILCREQGDLGIHELGFHPFTLLYPLQGFDWRRQVCMSFETKGGAPALALPGGWSLPSHAFPGRRRATAHPRCLSHASWRSKCSAVVATSLPLPTVSPPNVSSHRGVYASS